MGHSFVSIISRNSFLPSTSRSERHHSSRLIHSLPSPTTPSTAQNAALFVSNPHPSPLSNTHPPNPSTKRARALLQRNDQLRRRSRHNHICRRRKPADSRSGPTNDAELPTKKQRQDDTNDLRGSSGPVPHLWHDIHVPGHARRRHGSVDSKRASVARYVDAKDDILKERRLG